MQKVNKTITRKNIGTVCLYTPQGKIAVIKSTSSKFFNILNVGFDIKGYFAFNMGKLV